ncbi:MAG: hypothetical protein LBH97_05450 [Treponema sp.]|nr:hypothetical protein [Treponema sp.]
MSRKRLLYGLLFYALVGFPLNAATVSFLIIETGLPSRAPANPHSINWENGLFDVFFEQGHIVSNAPMMRLPEKPAGDLPDEAEGEFMVAQEGGVEFFIIALLEFSPLRGMELAKPHNVSLRLFRITPLTLIYEQQYSDNTPRPAREEYDALKKTVLGLVAHLY